MTETELRTFQARQMLAKKQPTLDELKAEACAEDERELQDSIANYLRLKEIPFRQDRFGKKVNATPCGWPDFSLVIQGKAVFIEAKTAEGQLSAEQESVRCALLRAGARYFVCRSLIEAIEAIQSITNENPTP